MQKLMLVLPSVLDGLADEALADHVASGGAPVADPFPAVNLAINEWLSLYHLLRTPEPDEDDEERLTATGEALLGTLQHRDVLPLGVRSSGWEMKPRGNVVQREGALHSTRPKDPPSYGQVLLNQCILTHTESIIHVNSDFIQTHTDTF